MVGKPPAMPTDARLKQQNSAGRCLRESGLLRG